MRFVLCLGLVLTVGLGLIEKPAFSQQPAPVENVSSFPPRTAAEEQKALHAPPGFEIQLVASEPEINKPLNLAFDDRGRLWVTSTVEYPYGTKREPGRVIRSRSSQISAPTAGHRRWKRLPTA